MPFPFATILLSLFVLYHPFCWSDRHLSCGRTAANPVDGYDGEVVGGAGEVVGGAGEVVGGAGEVAGGEGE